MFKLRAATAGQSIRSHFVNETESLLGYNEVVRGPWVLYLLKSAAILAHQTLRRSVRLVCDYLSTSGLGQSEENITRTKSIYNNEQYVKRPDPARSQTCCRVPRPPRASARPIAVPGTASPQIVKCPRCVRLHLVLHPWLSCTGCLRRKQQDQVSEID